MGVKAGRSGQRWDRLRAEVKARERYCYRCGQTIDWSIPYRDPHTGATNPTAGTVEHKIARSKRMDLAEDPGNLAASHLLCNQQYGDRDQVIAPLGLPSRDW